MTEQENSKPASPRSLWITLQPEEVIELKRIGMDRDEDGALTFFREILTPRLRAAARQYRIALDLLPEEASDERLPGPRRTSRLARWRSARCVSAPATSTRRTRSAKRPRRW